MFVRNAPLAKDVNTDTACASELFSPGTNIPTVGIGTVEYNRLVTRTELPELVSSTAPAEDGAPNAENAMSSNARDSRAANVKLTCGAPTGHAPRKHRYTAVTATGNVYDVLNTRTSEKNGDAADPTGNDVTAGIVNVSPKRESGGARRSASAAARRIRWARPTSGSMFRIIEQSLCIPSLTGASLTPL
jgi:hypothetical protein